MKNSFDISKRNYLEILLRDKTDCTSMEIILRWKWKVLYKINQCRNLQSNSGYFIFRCVICFKTDRCL